jgi:hypothetical protein
MDEEQERTPHAVRRGIVGHSDLGFTESFPWKPNHLPHLADFSELIVDLRTLPAAATSITYEDIEKLQRGLYRQVSAGGRTVAIVKRPLEKVALTMGPKDPRQVSPRVVEALGIDGNFMEENGRSMVVQSPRAFRPYLTFLKDYSFHFATDFRIRTTGPNYVQVGCEPIVETREKRLVAGLARIGNGALAILPDIPSIPVPRSLELIFESLTGIQVRTSAPAWAKDVRVHGVDSIRTEIQQHRAAIEQHEGAVRHLEDRMNQLLEFTGLLHLDGKELESIVKRVLVLLGGTVVPAKYAEEEYVLEFENQPYVVEVKGSTSSGNKSMVGQTIEHRMAAETKSNSDVGALLVVNAWRTTPPSERGPPHRMEIPDNVQRRAAEYGLPVVTGKQLLTAANLVMSGARNGPEILRDVLSSKGLVKTDYLSPDNATSV